MSNDIQLLTNRLLAALNSNYEVIDMSSVLSVITQLEQTTITTEQLEATRLARFLNLLRKRTWSEPLARRAKDLLKKWRELLITPAQTGQKPPPQQQQQQQPPPLPPIQQHPENLSLPARMSHQFQVSLSQPASPIVPITDSQRSTSRHHPGQPSSMENSSLPEYPCRSISMTAKNVPSTSRKQQQQLQSHLLSNLSNGGQHRTSSNVDQLHKTHLSKTVVQKPSSKSTALIPPQSTAAKKQQPISFANLIESQLHPPESDRSCTAGSSFLVEDNRSQSPMPRIPRNQRERQSPMIIEHSVSPLDLDQNSNPSREGSLAPPTSIISGPASLAVMSNNNNTISSCSRLLNGDYAGTTLELHDSNSNSNMQANMDTEMEGHQRFLGSRSSEHRKSKKHKKEKKRHRQERLQDSAPPVSLQASARPAGSANVPVLNDETQICGGGVFPTQENLSLSSSSLSMFPSISTTNITVPNNSNRGAGGPSHKLESDLTFAGKFKKNLPSTGGTTGAPNTGAADVTLGENVQTSATQSETPSVDNGQEISYATVINPMKKPKQKDGRSSVVVIESRSCSPFTPIGGNSNDSSTTSSRMSNRDLIEVVNQESQGVDDIQARTLLPLHQQQQQQHHHYPQHLPQPLKPIEIESSSMPEENKIPKRRGRKKGSKGADAMLAQFNTQLFEGSRLLSLASLSGSKKVKTTKELLADIQSRKLESATSSPTLPSQSRPPSTSSEPSLHSPSTSDACSTNATMSTVARSTPDQNIVSASNFRASGVEDDSGSNSSGGTAVAEKKGPIGFDNDTKLVVKAEVTHSIEEDIQKLITSLPPIDRHTIKWQTEEDVVCTCKVREVEPEIDVVLPKGGDEDETQGDVKSTLQPNKTPEVISVAVPPIPRVSSPVKLKLPQKPVKSIFDLDYDEEDDPLRTFVEAAKSCKTEADINCNQQQTERKHVEPEPVISISLPAQDQRLSIVTEPGSNAINGSLELVETLTEVGVSQTQQPPIQIFPQFEVVEDPDCQAKQRYEIQTNRITKFHVNALHNRFIPNVNGNWDESVPKNLDDNGKNIVAYDEMTPEGLYVRVVPQYNFLVMDRIPKDLSNVQFTKNYNKIKRLKLERMKMKRKRSGSSSAILEDKEGKQRKVECITPTCDDNVKNELTFDDNLESEPVTDDAFDNNMNLNNCTDSLSDSGKTADVERSSDDRMDCSVTDTNDVGKHRTDSAPPPPLLPDQQHSDGSRRSSSCSNSSVNLSSSISCRNNGRKASNDAGESSVDHEDLSYGHSNCSEDHDVDEDEEDDDYDEDEDDDYDDHGDFHEVVTHDMTSSTSTIGNKLVLTIKKTPSKVTPHSSPKETENKNKKRKILDCEGDDNQKIDRNDMAVEPPANVDSNFSENLNCSKVKEATCVEQAQCEFETTAVMMRSCSNVETINVDGSDPMTSIDYAQGDADADVVAKTCSSPGEPCSSDPVVVAKSISSEDSLVSDDEEEDELPDSNNELLLSFNHLSKENCTGLRVDPNTGKSQQFKEWHEVLQVRSYNDELLTILPYVVID